jgi:hypothetical protein
MYDKREVGNEKKWFYLTLDEVSKVEYIGEGNIYIARIHTLVMTVFF